MYHIVLFGGGTGSEALQRGINWIGNTSNVKLDIVINAYDDGKSTGECRKVFHYEILGPSDLRKNQLMQFSLQYMDELKDENSVQAQLYKLFCLRYSADSYREYFEVGRHYIQQQINIDEHDREYLLSLFTFFFYLDDDEMEVRREVLDVSFKDFSLANIFYAACAVQNGNSLASAGKKMSGILGISDNIHLISHVPLTLKGLSKNGDILNSEADIVNWNNQYNPISEVFLQNISGENYLPSIDENIEEGEKRVSDLIRKADIIIFSSGTQWSSLIPTYLHKGFREAVSSSSAKKYLVMNNAEDADMKGVGSRELCEIINKYIDLTEIKIIINNHADDSMKREHRKYNYLHGNLGENGIKHDAEKLIICIFRDFFGESVLRPVCIFDLDGTLWDSGELEPHLVGKENLNLFSGMIVSGNSYEHVKTIISNYCGTKENTLVFCDYGNTYFESKNPEKIKYLTADFSIDSSLVKAIRSIETLQDKVVVRGGVVLTLKPIEERKKFAEFLQRYLLSIEGDEYQVRIAGRTSIDICRANYNKATMIEKIMKIFQIDNKDIVFVGNELDSGNEMEIVKLNINTLQIRDIYECNIYLKVKKNEKW